MLVQRSLALLALPVLLGISIAHDFPDDYDSAKFVATVSLELKTGKVMGVSHNAMHWREDIWNAIQEGTTRQFFDPHVWERKFGRAVFPLPVTLAGREIPAGRYDLFQFVPGEGEPRFHLSFRKGDEAIHIPVELSAAEGPVEDHLVLALSPRGTEPGSLGFELKIFYGNLRGSLAGAIAESP